MDNPTLQAQVDAANAYEALFVPSLFGQWAPKVADAARIQPGQRVLDVACGTGILAREIALRIGSAERVVGIDPSPGMVAVAKQLAPAVEWREGVAESLPFPDESFDAVVSQFGLMFFTDRRQALREMLRVLTPGGRWAIAVWDSVDNIPAYASEVALLERMAGRQAADALRAPFVLGDLKNLAALFSEAGVVSAQVTTRQRRNIDMPAATIRLHRVLRTKPEKVYRAFLAADALCKWLPPYGFICTVQHLDARVSGTFRMAFRNFTTGQAHSFGGQYRELVPNERIRYTDQFDDPNLPGEMQVTVSLKPVSCGTELHVVQEGIPEAIPPEMCYLGWQESLTHWPIWSNRTFAPSAVTPDPEIQRKLEPLSRAEPRW